MLLRLKLPLMDLKLTVHTLTFSSLVTNPEPLEVLLLALLENQTLCSAVTAHSELKSGLSSNSSSKLEKSTRFALP
jgi:hypothetical protein